MKWTIARLKAAGAEAGLVLLNRRIAYSQRWGEKPLVGGFVRLDKQLVIGEVPATY